MKSAAKRRILVRVDSGNRIGMGHVAECISLAKSLLKILDAEILFLTRKYLPGIKKIKGSGFKVKVIPGRNSLSRDAKAILSAASRFDPSLIIVDLLRVNSKEKGALIVNDGYFKRLKGHNFKLIAIFDDNLKSRISADLIVNFNITQKESDYAKFPRESRYLVGPKYALIDESCNELWKKNKEIPRKCKTIFINQGGSDPYAITIKIIKALELLKLEQKAVVVIGPAVLGKDKNRIERMLPLLKNKYQFEFSVSHGRMLRIMAKSDLALTAAGNTLYELAILGVPSIVISHHERHDQVAKEFAKRNAVINMGTGLDLNESSIATAVNQLLGSKRKRSELSKNIKAIVDGSGSRRVTQTLAKL